MHRPNSEKAPQHTLLKNRIRALYLSKELVETELLRMGEQLSAVRCEETGKYEALDNCEILGERLFNGGTKISGSSNCFHHQ